MYEEPRFLPAGDQALVVEMGNAISSEINRRVRDLTVAIEKANIAGIFDLMPTYRSLLIYYNPLVMSASQLQERLESLEQGLGDEVLEKPQIVHIPTLYGGEYGPDIEFVAEHNGLSVEEVIEIHSSTDYLVYMMGFSPGFPYLGGLSSKLATPRLQTPRTQIPAGSVGIAESQTGVYPVESPGGWQLIGRTSVRMFDPNREPPALLNAGSYVRFVPVSGDEYNVIQHQVETGEYQVVTEAVP
jgi:inhibitor of KinA